MPRRAKSAATTTPVNAVSMRVYSVLARGGFCRLCNGAVSGLWYFAYAATQILLVWACYSAHDIVPLLHVVCCAKVRPVCLFLCRPVKGCCLWGYVVRCAMLEFHVAQSRGVESWRNSTAGLTIRTERLNTISYARGHVSVNQKSDERRPSQKMLHDVTFLYEVRISGEPVAFRKTCYIV